MANVIALVVADLERSRLGTASRLAARVAGATVLQHTLTRVARVTGVDQVMVVHPAGQAVEALAGGAVGKPVTFVPVSEGWRDKHTAGRIAGRKWALGSWRGGIGGMTAYDELLPAGPLLHALQQAQADSCLIVGGDWMLLDPVISSAVLDLHVQNPASLQMTFCQAPPGLSGMAVYRPLLEQLDQKSASFAQLLGYVPSRPQADPIGRDVCFQVEARVRACARRFIYDLPGSTADIDALAGRLGPALQDADALAVIAAVEEIERQRPCPRLREVTLELTPRRRVRGPIVPQHHVTIDRPDMPVELALDLVRQVGAMQDVVLTLGGLGDAMLHPRWADIVTAAHDAGVLGVTLETDLRGSRDEVARLLELPLDAVIVRLNADTAAVYEQVMAPGEGPEAFKAVVDHLQWLLMTRAQRATAEGGDAGLPWLVPSLVKTADTLRDMETFFDRWMHFTGQAIIAPATSGAGLMPELSPVCMASPRRRPCRQIQNRLTIHSTGLAPRCDQDWLATAPAGDATKQPLTAIWQALSDIRGQHAAGRWSEAGICARCVEWHRP
jgi:hypothetical protein